MGHKLIKYTKGGRFEHEDIEGLKGWHIETTLADGEFTACGMAVVDYDHDSKIVEKGGITCPHCLEVIKYYKQIKL